MRQVFAFPLVRLVIIAAGCAAILTIALAAEGGRHSIWISIVVTSIVVTLLVGLIALVERMTTGRSLASIGFDPRNAGRDIMLGLGLGTLMFSVVILVLALGGHYHVSAMHLTRDLGIAALFFASGAAFEELLFRGVLFRLIEEWAGTCIALALSALAFGAAHAFNPGATWVSTLAIALEAGVLLGSAFVVTRNCGFRSACILHGIPRGPDLRNAGLRTRVSREPSYRARNRPAPRG